MRFRFPLRYWVPGVLAALAVILTAFAFLYDWVDSRRSVEALTVRRATALGNVVTPALERELGLGDTNAVGAEISRLLVVPNLVLGLVIDESDTILDATDFSLRGASFGVSRVSDALPLVSRSRQTRSAQVEITADGRVLRAVFPFVLGLLPGELRASRLGAFYTETDLRSLKRAAMAGTVQRSLVMGFATLVVCLVVWGYFHGAFARRFERLVQEISRLSPGVVGGAVLEPGEDELARIANVCSGLATALQSRETALRQAARDSKLLFESNSLPMWVFDVETLVFLAANTAAVQEYGYTEEEFLGMTLHDIRSPGGAVSLISRMPEIRGGGVLRRAWEHRRKDGSLLDVEIYSHPLEFRGRAARITTVVNVTERRRAEAALRASEGHLQALAKAAPVGIYQTMRNGDCVYVNDRWCEIAGMSAGDAQGKGWLGTLHPEDLERVSEAWRRAVEVGGVFREEYRFTRAGGGTVWVYGQAVAELDEVGSVRGYVGTIMDITERRQLEEQLRQAQKMEAIGQLAGGVAHDFNNILASMLLQISMSKRAPGLSAAMVETFEDLEASTERAARLTKQLLAFSRRQVFQPRPLEMNQVVENLAGMLGRIIGEQVRLELRLAPMVLGVRGDPGLLEQVLMNLVVNARDAMPEGGVLWISTSVRECSGVETRVVPELAAGRYVCLSVTDTGVGISPEILPRVFEPFFTTKEVGKGTGLGLATVFGVVRQHGGGIQIDTQVGVGTTVHVLFPELRGALEDPVRRPVVVDPVTPRLGGGPLGSVLLVEDEEKVRRATCLLLEGAGYTVLQAGNGAEAMEAFGGNASTIRLLLTDMVMPGGMGGLQLAARLRESRPDLSVIYISGYSQEAAQSGLELGPWDAFLAKPFSPEELIGAIRRCIGGG